MKSNILKLKNDTHGREAHESLVISKLEWKGKVLKKYLKSFFKFSRFQYDML